MDQLELFLEPKTEENSLSEAEASSPKDPNVHSPKHYTTHPSGIECIRITEHMNFCLGNAIKYIWRADLKGGIQDLEKAKWCVDREIARLTSAK